MSTSAQEFAGSTQSLAENETLTGWKVILGVVEVRDMLKAAGKVYPGCEKPDSSANIAAFLTAAKMKDCTSKAISTKLQPGSNRLLYVHSSIAFQVIIFCGSDSSSDVFSGSFALLL